MYIILICDRAWEGPEIEVRNGKPWNFQLMSELFPYLNSWCTHAIAQQLLADAPLPDRY